MRLFVKAGPDGKSVGDCPFAHFVRMVLHEKGLDYVLEPCTKDTKPQWLIDFYEGKMPALQHRRECYTESDVIVSYIDFFFKDKSLTGPVAPTEAALEAVDGFFPAVARYLKHTPDGDEDDTALRENLQSALAKLNTHLEDGKQFLVGDELTVPDCALAPKLYHMVTGAKAFKSIDDICKDYPHVQRYIDTVFARKSFMETLYPEETVVWGWGNARS